MSNFNKINIFLFSLKSLCKKRRSIDEITNISLNYDATNPNTTNESTLNMTGNSFNITSKQEEDNLEDEVVFDELAMLCSGQFKGNLF